MSSGPACRNAYHREDHVVTRRNAAPVRHQVPSPYSTVLCRRCGAIWRTKAAYVAKLPDADKAVVRPTLF